MGHYIRVLATDSTPIALDDLVTCLPVAPAAELTIEAGDRNAWSQLVLRHAVGPEIAVIEKDDVAAGQLGEEEIAEFIEDVREGKPESAARWLESYLTRVRTIYAFHLLSGTQVNEGWNAVHTLQGCIWKKRGGILQADGEGFSNEDGYTVLWQFADNVEGEWNMAILNGHGNWVRFTMNLGDADQRSAFLEGRIPTAARLL